MASKSKIVEPEAGFEASLRQAISDSSMSDREREELAKDVHLLEASRCQDADLMIASNDNSARKAFARLVPEIDWLGRVIWVNPATDTDLVKWLEDGAPREESRRLSAYNPSQS